MAARLGAGEEDEEDKWDGEAESLRRANKSPRRFRLRHGLVRVELAIAACTRKLSQ